VKIALQLLLIALLVPGCARRLPPADPGLLDFIVDRQTTRQETLLHLGQPSATFESERVLTYRIGGNSNRGFEIRDRPGTWADSNYSLVLVFDADGVLTSHSLVPVR